MSGNPGVLLVREDTIFKGEVRNCRQMEVYGYVEGDVAADKVLIHQNGRCFGKLSANSADVHGTLQGNVVIKNLINIRSTGSVNGKVHYGQLSMEAGANLSAEMKNVPPTLAGDFDITVARGGSVKITLEDLNAVDPDDDAKDLTFTVSNAKSGFITLAGGAARAVAKFTQADLQAGRVLFKHDGTGGTTTGFDVVVADHTGATSGAAKTVKVNVRS